MMTGNQAPIYTRRTHGLVELESSLLAGLAAGRAVGHRRAGRRRIARRAGRSAGAGRLADDGRPGRLCARQLATMLWLTFLTILSVVVDFLATAEGARRFGAGRLAILGATLGLLVGIFFGLPGILFGPFVGAFAGHLAARANIDDSIRAGVGASIGILVGTLAKLAIGLLMIVWFVVAWIL